MVTPVYIELVPCDKDSRRSWSGGERNIHRGGYPPLVRAGPSSKLKESTKDIFMKRNQLIIPFLSAADFTVGCSKEETTTRPAKNSERRSRPSRIGAVVCGALLGTLTGCVGYVSEPSHAQVYAAPPPPPVYVESRVAVQDDYVYYPGYEVYYSSSRRQYTYRDGRSWVSRPAPPRVSAEVLFASPSVRLDFHDAPSFHHQQVVRQYPKHWAPPGSNRGNNGHDDDKKKGNRGRD
jgi:hypothetical protein